MQVPGKKCVSLEMPPRRQIPSTPLGIFFPEENDKWKLSVSHVGVVVCVVVVFAGLKFLVARVTHFGNSLPWAKAAAT